MSSAETPRAGKIGIITRRAPILRKAQLGLVFDGRLGMQRATPLGLDFAANQGVPRLPRNLLCHAPGEVSSPSRRRLSRIPSPKSPPYRPMPGLFRGPFSPLGHFSGGVRCVCFNFK
jgi:hypothetical protein